MFKSEERLRYQQSNMRDLTGTGFTEFNSNPPYMVKLSSSISVLVARVWLADCHIRTVRGRAETLYSIF